MKKKLFGNNIKPACRYCLKSAVGENGRTLVCSRFGEVESSDSCKSFSYSPLKRIPKKDLSLAKSGATNIDF